MGESHCLALRGDGTVVAWGTYLSGKPSSGWTNLAMNVPAGLTNVVAVAAGESDCLALRADGTILTWGGSFWCRDWSPEENTPIGLTKVQALGGGSCHCLALIGDGPPTLQAPINHPAMTAEGFSVSVPTQSGHVYCLEYKHSLADPDWTPLPLVAGTGHERTLTDPTTTGKQRFYRVRRW